MSKKSNDEKPVNLTVVVTDTNNNTENTFSVKISGIKTKCNCVFTILFSIIATVIIIGATLLCLYFYKCFDLNIELEYLILLSCVVIICLTTILIAVLIYHYLITKENNSEVSKNNSEETFKEVFTNTFK